MGTMGNPKAFSSPESIAFLSRQHEKTKVKKNNGLWGRGGFGGCYI